MILRLTFKSPSVVAFLLVLSAQTRGSTPSHIGIVVKLIQKVSSVSSMGIARFLSPRAHHHSHAVCQHMAPFRNSFFFFFPEKHTVK